MATSRYEPVGNTCPIIDDIIADINGCIDILGEVTLDNAYKSIEQVRAKLEALTSSWNKAPFEELREANLALRQWGLALVEELEEKEKEIETLERQIL